MAAAASSIRRARAKGGFTCPQRLSSELQLLRGYRLPDVYELAAAIA
jgi:hypothetical protein